MIVMIGTPRLDRNTETCDYVDNDCNGTTDDGLLTRYYADLDLDSMEIQTTILISVCSRLVMSQFK